MARRTFQVTSYTPTATADTTNLANGTYQAIGANGTGTGLRVSEIRITGLATSTGVALMQFARDSTVGATLTALAAPNSDGPQNTLTGALTAAMLTFVSAGTNPQRSAAVTAARLNLGLNTFGGISAWYGGPGEEWGIVGVAVNVSESSLSAFTGGSPGAVMSHIVYEPI